ncbi:uncharacterized protein PGTG_04161 [Puccinia graminis f. sp. tritici CRL 75-36-700-3]|uniref:Uncharacterized protein n=1 Tax=Puccinia graminis f. sp. tritici (strain CRL 75-36-700-3 / race SCCL) TaxID=418459 RepID=E3K1N0_PUCGT|nr:uncharacterized protein PGTG_04161 [Puccinia graminis f. sp. tritici CRL 75-36-700-3]EFP78205.2 hypothetical protein PGTG_04161 [Puccinia graminis f. sp. tritici CRL 75-36-700-3]
MIQSVNCYSVLPSTNRTTMLNHKARPNNVTDLIIMLNSITDVGISFLILALARGEHRHKVCDSTAKRQAYDKEDDVNDVMSLDSDDRQSSSSSSNKRNSLITLIDRISSPSIASSIK